ncbi:ATP-binding protein [Agrobacterium sp. rho-13.3]|uniref:HAMP domain-containing sensor histidine kinase n=1 Tax=Agrobacterium sp. rho-13.3 TaxID=3072980 RepID=UPI002A137EE5|nr:ATP-binding protein [Agrobacterium sp. rho-13.3]MDX8309261.1 ATP-binding protein [Agrobacterium sp. rho-13.3]
MSRLFWKLFVVIWLSIAGLLSMLILLNNIFQFRPPDHELEVQKRATVLEMAKELVSHGGPDLIAPIARAAVLSAPRLTLDIQAVGDRECENGNGIFQSMQVVRSGSVCYQLSARAVENGSRAFAFLAAPFLVAAVASLIAAFWLANYLAGPIVTLKNGLNALANGELHIRIGEKFGRRRDEISDLGLDFDSTASKLQMLQQIQQRLYHDVSHELRSPLSRIQAAIGVLRQNPAKLEGMMSRMEREIERLDTLVDEILTLAKLNSGYASSFGKSKIDIIDLLSAIVDDAAFEAKSKDVTVTLDSIPTFVCNINGELVYRALENVVRNAVKYTNAGTKVTIEARGVEIQARKILRVTVCDQGPGVPEEQIERIFEPFQRGVDTAEVAGHGLGLAIARQSLEILDGKIRAENGTQGGLNIIIEIGE